MADGEGTEAAGRVTDVLLTFMDGPRPLGVSAIARELDLSKAVVHRILKTLVHRGLLTPDVDTRGYHLGPSAAALGARALRESDLRGVAMPVLRTLQQATGETTTVSALVPGGRVYLDQIESAQEIRMTVEVGRRFPLHAGSSSTCILAFLPLDQREAVLSGPLEQVTTRTLCDPGAVRDRLRVIRDRGYATSDGERQEGAASAAAPVFGIDGDVLGAVSVCGPAARIDPATRDRFVPLLKNAADQISRGLGWRGGLPHHPERATA